jgi:hypothetical protein
MGLGNTDAAGIWFDTVFTPSYMELSKAYDAWKNPATRTPTITAKLIEVEKVFIPIYRQLYTGFLKSSPLVTNDDLLGMSLPQRTSGRKPSPIPVDSPDADADTSRIRRVGIHYYESAGTHKRGKPDGVHGAETRWGVFDTSQEVTIEQLTHSSFDTRSPLVLEFKDEQRGKVLYFALRWENTRGEKGPFGPILKAIIP